MSHQRNAEIVRAYAEGAPVAEIAGEHGISTTRVQQILREAGVPPARRKGAPPSSLPLETQVAALVEAVTRLQHLCMTLQYNQSRMLAWFAADVSTPEGLRTIARDLLDI